MELKTIIALIIRTVGGGLVAWLAAKGKLGVDEVTAFLVTGGTIGVMIIWSFVQKLTTQKKIDAALQLPAFSSREDLQEKIKELSK